MDKAKAAVSDFLHKTGKHDTTVHENVAPAVQQETVRPTRHEQVQTAVDREVHQDHYHTSVQPVQDREILPEQHHHNLVGVEHRKHEHDDADLNARKLDEERSKFKNTTTTAATSHTESVAPVVAGEHVHHHIHETIQPVVEKETIQPHVVHTTVPVHEVHQNAGQHHTTSSLPAMTMDQFLGKGGSLEGRGERYDAFEGAPRMAGGTDTNHKKVDSAIDGRSGTAVGGFDNVGGSTNSRITTRDRLEGQTVPDSTTTGTGKPSLLDKLNPNVDADRDGKRGVMD